MKIKYFNTNFYNIANNSKIDQDIFTIVYGVYAIFILIWPGKTIQRHNNNVESLNLATSVGIVLSELKSQTIGK